MRIFQEIIHNCNKILHRKVNWNKINDIFNHCFSKTGSCMKKNWIEKLFILRKFLENEIEFNQNWIENQFAKSIAVIWMKMLKIFICYFSKTTGHGWKSIVFFDFMQQKNIFLLFLYNILFGWWHTWNKF